MHAPLAKVQPCTFVLNMYSKINNIMCACTLLTLSLSLNHENCVVICIRNITVVGWATPTLEIEEGDTGVGVNVQLVKGDESLLPIVLRFTYAEVAGSATSNLKMNSNTIPSTEVCLSINISNFKVVWIILS